jgi:oligopeptide/dipeptide ABC transporter ATP-binding protein
MTPLLELEHLSVTFATRAGPARAVEDVSLAIAPGETVALVGESGCGKTVTALSVLRLLPESATLGPESRIRFEGRDVLALDREELRRLRGGAVGMVFQEPGASLNPVLTIGAHLVETIQAHENVPRATARARAHDLLATVGLRDPDRMVARYGHELSGGMQQRAYLPMALAAQPRLLIADEPTTALDVTTQAQILALLADLTGRLGMAMLLITHNLGIAAAVAHRVAVMYAGRIVEVAPRAALFAHPAHPYTQGLLQAAPRLDGPTRPTPAIPGAVPSATAWPEGCRFRPRCARAWDRCASEPTLAEAAPDHTARCWLVTEPRGGTA